MPNLHVVAILKRQLKEAKATVQRLHHAVDALERLGRSGRRRAGKISAAGRKRIAAAQKARWKKFRCGEEVTTILTGFRSRMVDMPRRVFKRARPK